MSDEADTDDVVGPIEITISDRHTGKVIRVLGGTAMFGDNPAIVGVLLQGMAEALDRIVRLTAERDALRTERDLLRARVEFVGRQLGNIGSALRLGTHQG